MAGLKPKYNLAALSQSMHDKTGQYNEKVVQALTAKGEQFVAKARLKTPAMGSFTDRTGNLRSSIGYLVVNNGRIVKRNFSGSSAQGMSNGLQIANRLSREYPKGVMLIGVAGMHYAAAVESKNYDVISGSAPGDREIKQLLDAIKF